MRSTPIVIALLAVAACTTHSSYPTDWPAPIQGSGTDCPDITGTFQNDGTGTDGGLYDDLTAEGWYGSHWCLDCKVELRWLDEARDELHARLIPSQALDKSAETTLRRSNGDFSCADGALLVPFKQGGELIAAGAIEWGRRSYRLAEDDSLIRFEERHSMGHDFLVVPFYFNTDTYARWLRATPSG